MGKASRVHRSRLRMTRYNTEKSNKLNNIQQSLYLIVEQENFKLKKKVCNLETGQGHIGSAELQKQVNEALLAQKERYSIRHESIVKLLQERYKVKLDSLSESYQSQINELTSTLSLSESYQSRIDELTSTLALSESSRSQYQSQIVELKSKMNSTSEELLVVKNSLFSSNVRKPVFSACRYNGMPP